MSSCICCSWPRVNPAHPATKCFRLSLSSRYSAPGTAGVPHQKNLSKVATRSSNTTGTGMHVALPAMHALSTHMLGTRRLVEAVTQTKHFGTAGSNCARTLPEQLLRCTPVLLKLQSIALIDHHLQQYRSGKTCVLLVFRTHTPPGEASSPLLCIRHIQPCLADQRPGATQKAQKRWTVATCCLASGSHGKRGRDARASIIPHQQPFHTSPVGHSQYAFWQAAVFACQ